MGEKVVVGVDIGGTKVAAGMVTLDGEIVRQTRAPMSSRGDAAAGLSSVETAIRTLVSSAPSSSPCAMSTASCSVMPSR